MSKLLSTTAVTLLASIAPAMASPISAGSTLSLDGTDSFTPTSISFPINGNVGADSGDFVSIGTCANCVTFANFSNTSTNFLAYHAWNGGIDTDIVLDSVSFVFTPVDGGGDTLSIAGNGIAHLTGFDPTPGTFLLTTQGFGNDANAQFTFSSTSVANAVAEPATLGILGAAFSVLAIWRRKRPSSRQEDYTVARCV